MSIIAARTIPIIANAVRNWVSNPITTAIGIGIWQVAAPYFEGLPSGTGVIFGQVVAHGGRALGRSLIGRCVRSVYCPMQSELRTWCREVAGTPAHANRLIAAQRIRTCYVQGSPELNLNNLGLTSLPAGAIGRLTHLRGLYLDQNQLSTLPEEIGQLTNLRDLILTRNQLSTLPAAMSRLRHLSFLRLHGYFRSRNSLQNRVCDDNPFQNLPKAIRAALVNDPGQDAATVVQGFARHTAFVRLSERILSESNVSPINRNGISLPSAVITHSILGFLSPTKNVNS